MSPLLQLGARILRTADKRLLWKFVWNFGVKGMLSVERFKRRLKRGEYFPPFLYLSIVNSCNLRCQGCWVDVESPREMIDIDDLNKLVRDAKKHGNSFFGVLGGEPFLHPQLLDFLGAHPDCYFQVFTNGQFITEKVAAELRRLGNVTPLISIEGREIASDQRRGSKNVLNRTLRGLDALHRGAVADRCGHERLPDEHRRAAHRILAERIDRSWCALRLVSHLPAGRPKNANELALRPDQLVQVRQFIVECAPVWPIGIIDAYYDDRGQALCPMATGISHHISPRGDIEPCPIIQFATENIRDGESIFQLMRDSAFLTDFRELSARATRGCVVLERPDLVRELVIKHGARDTTLRGTAMAELESMTPRSSQYLPGAEIPEEQWIYRLAKKYWFNDFGAYQRQAAQAMARSEQLARTTSQLLHGLAAE